MQFGFEEAIRGAPPMMFWPAITSALYWNETRNELELVLFSLLIVTGGVAYIFTKRLSSLHNKDEAPMFADLESDIIHNVNTHTDLILNGKWIQFVDGISPLEARALPARNDTAFLVILSLLTILVSFILLWIRTTLDILTQPDVSPSLLALGVLPYLFLGVTVGAFLWVGEGATESNDME